MPWVVARLRGSKVYARVGADGAFEVRGGRVEIRYKKGAGKTYQAAAGNLERDAGAETLPDDLFPDVPSQDLPVDVGPASRAPHRAPHDARAERAAGVHANDPATWIVYADGACSGNPGPAGFGVVVVSPGGQTEDGFEYLGEATNNIAELSAVLRALAWIPPQATRVTIHTDSQYAIGVLTKGWKAKANVALVAEVRTALGAHGGVRLAYVPGHAGVPLNERADELARQAVATRSSRPLDAARFAAESA